MNDITKPYNDLPRLPINYDFQNEKITNQLFQSISALSSLNASINLTPNPDILLNNLSISEAKNSSEIENIVTTNDDIYKAVSLNKKISPETKEILNYRKALWKGLETLKKRPLVTNSFEEITNIINENNAGIRKLPGNALKNSKEEIIYTPPFGEDVIRDLLDNLSTFIYSDNDRLHPLVKMAIIHYQYESIHPFYDGNGRSGRILNILYLIEKKQIDHPSLFMSRYILNNKKEYYTGFERIRKHNDWTNWIIYILKAVEETAKYNLLQVIEITKLIENTKVVLSDILKKSINISNIATSLFKQPYCRPIDLINEDIKNYRTSVSYLKKIEKSGLIKKEKTQYGEIYRNQMLISVLRQKALEPKIIDTFNEYHCDLPLTLKNKE